MSEEKGKYSARSSQDSAWKDVLDTYFKEFMEFFYPDIANKIDWSHRYIALDKEMQSITADAMVGKKIVDKLFKVRCLDGQEETVLIHVEAQGQKEEAFPKRLFQYYYRLFDNHDGQSILTLTVLTDDNKSWYPKKYQREVLGFSVLSFNFQVCKLLDYQNYKEDLEKTNNPFGLVVLVHLAAIETRRNPQARYKLKFSLTRLLLKKGHNKDYIINLFKVIDWGLVLPPDLKIQYNNAIEQLKEEKGMSYVLSAVRDEIEKNHQSWLQQGLQQGRREEDFVIAKKMLARGYNRKDIKELLELSDQDLFNLED